MHYELNLNGNCYQVLHFWAVHTVLGSTVTALSLPVVFIEHTKCGTALEVQTANSNNNHGV